MAAAKPALLVLTSTYPRRAGDTEPAFVHELSRRLAAHYDVVVLAPHTRSAQTREQMQGVTVRRYRYLPEAWEVLAYDGGIPERLRRNPFMLLAVPFLVLGLFIAAIRECRTRRIEVIHAHWILPQGVLGAVLRGLGLCRALVCTSHGADLHTLNLLLLRWLKSWTLRRADAVTVVSQAMRDAASALGARSGSVDVAPMGVEVSERFIPPQSAARKEGLILFVGRLVEKKGLRHLLDAFRIVHAQREDARLVIIGDGPERNALQQQVQGLGLEARVSFAGALPQDQLVDWYQSASVAVFPFVVAAGGDQEGLGLVVVEAQACGCPVIAGDLPAVRDTIDDGSTGILVPSGDADKLARSILEVLSDPAVALRLGANGRRSAVDRFSWERIADQYHAIIERVRTHP